MNLFNHKNINFNKMFQIYPNYSKKLIIFYFHHIFILHFNNRLFNSHKNQPFVKKRNNHWFNFLHSK